MITQIVLFAAIGFGPFHGGSTCPGGACQAPQQARYTWIIADDCEEAYLYKDGKQVGGFRYKDSTYLPCANGTWGTKCDPPVQPPQQRRHRIGDHFRSALHEVNFRRAQRGLPLYVEDESLTEAAAAAADYRAARLIQGHTSNDFAFLPQGAFARAAGCAAWDDSTVRQLGWGSCCSDDIGYTHAGAAFAYGSDGRRYMHLFVR